MLMLNVIISFSIIYSVILGTGALSGLFSERSGVVNIGINGMIIFGSLSYCLMNKLIGSETNPWVQLPVFIIVGLIVSLFALLHGLASITLKANQVASGTAINLLASGVALFLINYLFEGGAVSEFFTHVSLSQKNISWKYAISLPVFFCLFLFAIAFVFLKYTKLGKYIKAAGENPHALESQGISVIRIRYYALLISGFLAGISGCVYAQTKSYFSGNVEGLGFIALAILIFGRWRIVLVLMGALLYGTLSGINQAIIINPDNISRENWIIENRDLFQIMPFLFSILTLIFTSHNSKVPKFVGVPYEKSGR